MCLSQKLGCQNLPVPCLVQKDWYIAGGLLLLTELLKCDPTCLKKACNILKLLPELTHSKEQLTDVHQTLLKLGVLSLLGASLQPLRIGGKEEAAVTGKNLL